MFAERDRIALTVNLRPGGSAIKKGKQTEVSFLLGGGPPPAGVREGEKSQRGGRKTLTILTRERSGKGVQKKIKTWRRIGAIGGVKKKKRL